MLAPARPAGGVGGQHTHTLALQLKNCPRGRFSEKLKTINDKCRAFIAAKQILVCFLILILRKDEIQAKYSFSFLVLYLIELLRL